MELLIELLNDEQDVRVMSTLTERSDATVMRRWSMRSQHG